MPATGTIKLMDWRRVFFVGMRGMKMLSKMHLPILKGTGNAAL